MLNYAVEPALLLPYVPAGTELDAFGGRTYFSVIGFEFNQTRVLGLAIPFHRSFEEVNLRFYVRRGDRRGVVFIRELVPRFAVAAVARVFFGENYSSVPMSHDAGVDFGAERVSARYSWGRAGHVCQMRIESQEAPAVPHDGSLEQFITEHYWGYAAQRGGGCLEYEVQHPRWAVRKATQAAFTGNAAQYYGRQFADILCNPPESAFLAEGSAVTVFKGQRILT